MERSLYFILFEATPRFGATIGDHAVADGVGGAFVSCWINRASQSDAVVAARALIATEGWIAGEPDEVGIVRASDYAPGNPRLQFFEQALIDDEVLVFHTFPDVDHEHAG